MKIYEIKEQISDTSFIDNIYQIQKKKSKFIKILHYEKMNKIFKILLMKLLIDLVICQQN